MTTDRELLELAAKAAGIALISWTNMYDACDEIGGRFITQPRGEPWNPLEDDGDALRLAVKLRLTIYPPEAEGDGATISTPGVDGDWITEECTGDVFAATRRAIVRAAAAIGKAMK